jgi:hypothetical protein
VLEEEPLLAKNFRAKLKKFPAHFRIPGLRQAGRDEPSIASPHIRIGISSKANDIRVIGCDDRTPIIDLRS